MPRSEWEEELRSAPENIGKRLEFMSAEHHAVRNFVVREMPGRGRPISIEQISCGVGLPYERTTAIVRHSKGQDIGAACGQLRAKLKMDEGRRKREEG